MYSTRVLASLALLVGVTHAFSWDIVVGKENRLEFFNNGSLEHIINIPDATEITAITYDAVEDRVLFADFRQVAITDEFYAVYELFSISSLVLTTGDIQLLVQETEGFIVNSIAYDPVTQLLFWNSRQHRSCLSCKNEQLLYSLSLKPGWSNENEYVKLLVMLDKSCRNIAVDSRGGFIYWSTDDAIERAAFDGSKREVLVNSKVLYRQGLAIDQETQKIYWIEQPKYENFSIKSADFNGKNITTFHFIGEEYWAHSLTVSKDFIYWWSDQQKAIFQLKKCQERGVEPIVYSKCDGEERLSFIKDNEYRRNTFIYQIIAAKYTVKEQTLGIQSCEALKNNSSDTNSMNVDLSTDHATKVSAECHNYCFQGNCSVGAVGHPKCSCEAGFSGERCEVNACYKHCLNGGVCSLSDEGKPVCQCPAGYEGKRCDVATAKTDVPVCADKMTQQILLEVKQVREDLQYTLQLYLDKFDENAAKIQICEESIKDNLQNLVETTSKT